jgi:Fur family ferric uptake transcriptional regulator
MDKISIKEKVRLSGLKLTKQREAICQVFFAQTGHRSAEEILNSARMLDAKVSLATVYRTLKVLQEFGFVLSHNFKDGQALFEPRFEDEHHDHLICKNCGKIVEFMNIKMEMLQIEIAKAYGFSITDHKMEIYGLCENCR